MTEKQAIDLFDSGWWKKATPEEIVNFQLWEERLCMPFGDFQAALELVLGRDLWTTEFLLPELLKGEVIRKRKP